MRIAGPDPIQCDKKNDAQMPPTPPSLDYYRHPAAITRIDKHLDAIRWLTNDVRAICQVVQGLLIHDAWISRYGSCWTREQTCGLNIAYIEDLLDKAKELDGRSFAIARSPEKRVIGCCREFATLLCAMLRQKGIPARSRCGFATYLARPGYFEDHWICEYWCADESRWVRVDPQIDPFQQSYLSADFNPLDVPASRFIVAGLAWQQCRRGECDPDQFGIGGDPKRFGLESLYGLWFVRGNLLRDFAALNKVEVVPYLVRLGQKRNWDSWRLLADRDADLSSQDYALLDRIAELSLDPDGAFADIQNTYQTNAALHPPLDITSRT